MAGQTQKLSGTHDGYRTLAAGKPLRGFLTDFCSLPLAYFVRDGYAICSGWNTSSNCSAVKNPSFTQASFREMFSR